MNSKEVVKELMEVLNSMVLFDSVPKHDIKQLIDAHLNLVVMYCDHIEVDPVDVFKEIAKRVAGGECEDPFDNIDDSIIN